MTPARVVKKGTRKHAPSVSSGPCFPPAVESAPDPADDLDRCIRETMADAEFVEQYRQATGARLAFLSDDELTEADRAEARAFFDFVRESVWRPWVASLVEVRP